MATVVYIRYIIAQYLVVSIQHNDTDAVSVFESGCCIVVRGTGICAVPLGEVIHADLYAEFGRRGIVIARHLIAVVAAS